MADWFLALKLVEPRLEHPRQLVDTFDTLYRDGLIQLHTKTGSYDGGDDMFFSPRPIHGDLDNSWLDKEELRLRR